jgi:hypothetical protein
MAAKAWSGIAGAASSSGARLMAMPPDFDLVPQSREILGDRPSMLIAFTSTLISFTSTGVKAAETVDLKHDYIVVLGYYLFSRRLGFRGFGFRG